MLESDSSIYPSLKPSLNSQKGEPNPRSHSFRNILLSQRQSCLTVIELLGGSPRSGATWIGFCVPVPDTGPHCSQPILGPSTSGINFPEPGTTTSWLVVSEEQGGICPVGCLVVSRPRALARTRLLISAGWMKECSIPTSEQAGSAAGTETREAQNNCHLPAIEGWAARGILTLSPAVFVRWYMPLLQRCLRN